MNKMTKMLFAALMVFTMSSAYSAEQTLAYCDGCQKSERLCSCPKQECNSCRCEPCCCECVSTPATPCPTESAYNAPYREASCWDLFGSASYIYWLAAEDNLELGLQGDLTFDPVLQFGDTSGKFVKNDCDYNSGFKVGLGKNFCWDNWDLYAEYTWFHNTTTTSATGTAESPISNLLWTMYLSNANLLTPFSQYERAKSKWELDLDILDVELSRPYYVGCKLLFRPHFGLRAAWIDQQYKLDFTESLLSTDVDANGIVRASSDSWGIGPRAGFDTRWMFCGEFYFYGNFAASILYTDYSSIKNSEVGGRVIVNSLGPVSNSVTGSMCTARPNMELALGLGWADYCDCDAQKWYLNLSVGYEFHTFWDQNVMRKVYQTNASGGNLYLHGLTVTARLDF